MRRYFFHIYDQRGTDEDPSGVELSGHSVAMLRALTMCAEIGCIGGFYHGFAVSVRDEHGTIGRVSVVVSTAASGRRDARSEP